MMMRSAALVAALAATTAAGESDVVFSASPNNGFFTPFNSSTPEAVRYADSGWLSNPQPETFFIDSITMNMAAAGGTFGGSFDLVFSFHDGSPSGLVFGTGAELYSTVIEDVTLPQADKGFAEFFEITVPLPNVETTGGFNNVGWSVGVRNVDYDGDFGFQVSTTIGQTVGFFTNNASTFDGTDWSLFAFSGDPVTGVANYSVEMTGFIPAPGSAAVLVAGGLVMARRRR